MGGTQWDAADHVFPEVVHERCPRCHARRSRESQALRILWSLAGCRANFFPRCPPVQPEVQFELRFVQGVGAMSGATRGRTPWILHRTRRTWRTGTF